MKDDRKIILIGITVNTIVLSLLLNLKFVMEITSAISNEVLLGVGIIASGIIEIALLAMYFKKYEKNIWKRKNEYLISVFIIIIIYILYFSVTNKLGLRVNMEESFPLDSLVNTLIAFLAITFLLEKVNQIKTVNKTERLLWRYNNLYIRLREIRILFVMNVEIDEFSTEITSFLNQIIELKKEVEFILSTFYSDIDNDDFNLIMQIRVNLDLIINKLQNTGISTEEDYTYIKSLIEDIKNNSIALNNRWVDYQLNINRFKKLVSKKDSIINSDTVNELMRSRINNNMAIEEFVLRNRIIHRDEKLSSVRPNIYYEVIYRLIESEVLDSNNFRIEDR